MQYKTTPVRAKYRRLAQEIIDFQNDQFGVQIESLVTKIYQTLDNGGSEASLVSQLSDLIFKRLGIRVQIHTKWEPMGMSLGEFNKHHMLMSSDIRGHLDNIDIDIALRNSKDKKGYVNLKDARVSGIFSEYVFDLHVNFEYLRRNWQTTPAEVTAQILHELGHAFYTFEYEDRLETSNQVLANVYKAISNTKQQHDLTYIYHELSTLDDNVTPEDIEIIVNGNRVIAGYRLFTMVIKYVTSQLPEGTYDRTSSEQLADNFATRFGYGRQLTTGLAKLETYFKGGSGYTAYPFMEMLAVILSSLGSLCTIIASFTLLGIGVGVFMTLGISMFINGVMMTKGSSTKDYNYDTFKDRYKRIRNDYIAYLKDPKIPDQKVKAMVMEIKIIDDIITKASNQRGVLDTLADYVFSKDRRVRNSIDEQRLLEDLAHNDLFLKAAALRTL